MSAGEEPRDQRTRIVKGVEPGHSVMLYPCKVDKGEARLITSVRGGSATVAMKPPALREYAGQLLALALALEADADAATTATEGGE
jgi:hypothetical protein